MKTVNSMAPVFDVETRVMVLGTLPSEESVMKQQYYANPRNQFWRIMSAVCNAECGSSYEERISFLRQRGVGLWDVLEEGQREGSADATIRDVKPNSLDEFLAQYPGITCLALNGSHAKEYFEKYAAGKVGDSVTVMYLPSSSPRNRGSVNEKADAWKAILGCIDMTPAT